MKPTREYLETTPYGVLCRELGTDRPTIGALHEKFLSVDRPNLVVARMHLTLPPTVDGKIPTPDHVIETDEANRMYAQGAAICVYIDQHLAQEHPQDKRFLLRYMEQHCMRLGIPKQTLFGFGHRVIFSREPLPEQYSGFDNSLYVPPLTGHWAIVPRDHNLLAL